MSDSDVGSSGQSGRNVVVLLSDDQGAWALGAAGNPEIHTPHLDRLAAAGVRWTAMHCASPVCSPARASMLTGVPPTVHGVADWIAPSDGPAPRYLDGAPTYVERLSDAGWRTAMIGKWHLGDASTPTAGFDDWFALEASHGPYHDAPIVASPSLAHLRTDGYGTDRIADAAIEVITRDDTPHYVHVAFTAPHHPWVDQHPGEFVGLYTDCTFDSCPVEPPHPWQHPQVAPAVAEALADPRESLIGYFAAVSAMDAAIGRILEVIDLDTTLVIFTSDNGYACGQHGLWGKGNATLPLNLLDTSVLVPMIAVGLPGGTPGEVRDRPVSHLDLHPTVLAAAGQPTDDALPGRDLSAPPTGEPVVVTDEYGAARMIRTERWCLITRDDGPWQLFDQQVDPRQRHDLIDDPAAAPVRDELAGLLAQWYARWAPGPYDPRTAGVTGRGQRGRLSPVAASRLG